MKEVCLADSIIQVPVDSTGKKLRTVSNTVGANTVEQQVVTLADSAGNLIDSDTSGRLLVVLQDGSDVGTGLLSASVYTDTTGAANGSMIALLKGIFKALSGILTFKRALGTTTITGVTVTTSSASVVSSNTSRKSLLIINNSIQTIYVDSGTATADYNSIAIPANGGQFQTETTSSGFNAIVASGTALITVVEDA